jgi:hypothetical protein
MVFSEAITGNHAETRGIQMSKQRGRKSKWISKNQAKLRQDDGRSDDFRRVIAGTMPYSDYEKKWGNPASPRKYPRSRYAILFLAGLLAGCSATSQSAQQTMSDQEAFALARKRVTESLKDPDSARFGQGFTRSTISISGADQVCGTVNAKNGFGGYAGMEMFSYRLADDSVVMGDAARRNCKLLLP